MERKTVVEVYDLLKPKQREYIVGCVRRNSDRRNFHLGLLPFLPLTDAAKCLKFDLDGMQTQVLLDDTSYPMGRKFIRAIISILETKMLHKICEDETSVVMLLKSVKLAKEFGRRFHEKFCVTVGVERGDVPNPVTPENLVQLELVGKDKWRVTASTKLMDRATTYLADYFR